MSFFEQRRWREYDFPKCSVFLRKVQIRSEEKSRCYYFSNSIQYLRLFKNHIHFKLCFIPKKKAKFAFLNLSLVSKRTAHCREVKVWTFQIVNRRNCMFNLTFKRAGDPKVQILLMHHCSVIEDDLSKKKVKGIAISEYSDHNWPNILSPSAFIQTNFWLR